MTANQILVVDDEVGIRELLFEILRDEGYAVRLAENAQAARQHRRDSRPDLVLLDIWMPDTDGITLLKEWAGAGQLTMPVVMMSGHGTIDSAVEATRIGAFDFLEKPISLPKLLATVGKALAGGRAVPRAGLSLAQFGKGRVAQELRQRLDQVSRLRTPVLLVGEPGCGFELAARHLHHPNTPWVAPADAQWLVANPFGPLNEAKDGTLFVDAVSRLDKAAQKGLSQLVAKLEKFNTRLVCASTEPLASAAAEGRFDAALCHAISGLTIRVPSLGEHPEDIPELATGLLTMMAEAREVPHRVLTVGAQNALRNLEWAGNLPVLQNVVKTLALTVTGTEIGGDDVARVAREFGLAPREAPVAMAPPSVLDLPLREARERFERQYFLHHIRREEGNMSRVADRVGLERTHLYRKLKQLGIRPSARGEEPPPEG
ncbi:MAG TPA: sigma-54 dependent transcriptional regulator [Usitatibacteraceae bacterium]|nr:sigma-54 dependent transcriptional regulator [Usitatibacteraceae bacterium]